MSEQTTPLDIAAREEAERRYPTRYPDGDWRPHFGIERDAFEAGAHWGSEQADAALTKALGQRDAVAVTAERMTSYARQAEAVLREVAALADGHERTADIAPMNPGAAAHRQAARGIRAILARAGQAGDDR